MSEPPRVLALQLSRGASLSPESESCWGKFGCPEVPKTLRTASELESLLCSRSRTEVPPAYGGVRGANRLLAARALTGLHYCALRSSAMILSKHLGPALQTAASPTAPPFLSSRASGLPPALPLLILLCSPWKLEILARPVFLGSEGTLGPGRGPAPTQRDQQACWTLFPCCTTVGPWGAVQ